jgi:hypothetical protein
MNINFYEDVDWLKPGAKKQRIENQQLAVLIWCIMDSKVIRPLIVDEWFGEKILKAKTFEDAASANNPFLVKITIEDEETINLVCDEMLYAMLLSEPTLIKIGRDADAHLQAVNVGWSYIDGKFIPPGEQNNE